MLAETGQLKDATFISVCSQDFGRGDRPVFPRPVIIGENYAFSMLYRLRNLGCPLPGTAWISSG